MDSTSSSATFGRRAFLVAAGTLAAAALVPSGVARLAWAQAGGELALPPLPYPRNALEPYLSTRTLEFHHGKHHQAYVTQANALKKNTPFETMDLVQIIRQTAGKDEYKPLFNNAAQVWNHTFFWNSMKPHGGGKPDGKLLERINASFGSFEKFSEQFIETATSQFGSGWGWLAADGSGTLKIVKTPNAENPLTMGLTPLLTVDVWEHAYYLDYQNRRKDYVSDFVAHLANWKFAEDNLDAKA